VNQFTTNRAKNEGNSLYSGFDITMNKQHADRWSYLVSYTPSYRKVGVNDPLTPNAALYSRIAPSWDQAFKMNGTYDLPFGLRYGATFQAQSGDWYGRSVQIRNALNSTVSVPVEQLVARYQWVMLWDNRISKTFQIGDRHSIEGTLDVFNTTNVNTVRTQGTTQIAGGTNLDYGKPLAGGGIDASAASSIIAPRIYRFGARWRF
jgi:hypothetical protein